MPTEYISDFNTTSSELLQIAEALRRRTYYDGATAMFGAVLPLLSDSDRNEIAFYIGALFDWISAPISENHPPSPEFLRLGQTGNHFDSSGWDENDECD
jgi:hypothetical protein